MLDATKQEILDGLLLHDRSAATAKQLCVTLSWTRAITSQRLGHLFFQGVLDRDDVRGPGCSHEYRYWQKLPTVPAPPAWGGDVRLAERVTEEADGS